MIDEKKLLEKLEELKFANEQSKTDWIPFEQREADEEEKEYWLENYGQEIEYMLCGRLPDEDEEIIVSYSNGCVGEDIFLRDGVDCYLDSGNELVTEAIAWMPKPQPYKKKVQRMSEYTGCDICKHQKKSKREKPCLECTKNRAINNFEPMTNADAIRNFSDEELAEFLVKVNCSYSEPCMTGETDCRWEDYPTHDKGCKDCFLEWLQAEVKEGNSNENT